MTDPDRTPVRPAAVVFHAPTHEPLVVGILITQDPDTGQFRAWVRPSKDYASPDRDLIALLVQSAEIRNLAERENPNA